ncbi:MAG: GtrA family protein [bacterium]|nr:GtrA family protein [bacterium]
MIKIILNHRAIRYLISGGSAAVINLTMLFILVHFFYMWYLLASVVAFIVAVAVSFMMQKFFTFNDYTKEKIRQQSLVYLGIQILNLGVNALLLYISVDMLHIHYLISQFFVLGLVAVYSFFVFKYLVFSPDSIHNENS